MVGVPLVPVAKVQRRAPGIVVVITRLCRNSYDAARVDAPIGTGAEGVALGPARRLLHEEAGEVRAVDRAARAGAAGGVGLGGDILRREVHRAEAGDDDAEVFRDGPRPIEIEAGVDDAVVLVEGEGALAEGELVAVGGGEDAVVELGLAALEGALAHDIDGAAEGVGGVGGGGDLVELDARGVVERHLLELEIAALAGGDGVGGGGAVNGDAGHAAGDAAHGDGDRLTAFQVEREAGQVLQKLGDIAAGDVTEGIGGDDVLDIGGVALLVGRERLALGDLGSLDGEGIELEGVAGLAIAGAIGEADIARERLAREGDEGDLLRVEAGIRYLEHDGAAAHGGEMVDALLIGEHGLLSALHGDAGIAEILAGDGALHAAGDDGGAGGRGSGRSGGSLGLDGGAEDRRRGCGGEEEGERERRGERGGQGARLHG